MPAISTGASGIATPVANRTNSAVNNAPGFKGQFEQELQKHSEVAKDKIVTEAKTVVDQDKLEKINEGLVALRDKQLSNPMADTTADTLAMLAQVRGLAL